MGTFRDDGVMASKFEIFKRWITFKLRRIRCEYCGSLRGVKLEPGRTAYVYDGPTDTFADPNRRSGYCRPCAEDYHTHWDAMWDEYNQSRG